MGAVIDPSFEWDRRCERAYAPRACGEECANYKPCPCGASVYCVANDEWFEPREANEEYECFEAKR